MRNTSSGLMSNLRDVSFISSLQGANSFKEFFLMIDAGVALEWRVEMTFLKQLFCCGAETSCALPKWTGDFTGVASEDSFAKTIAGWEFASKYFSPIVCRDDLFLLRGNFPLIFEFYRSNSSSMMIGSLDNNSLIRQTPYLLHDMNFQAVNSIKLGPQFLSNPKAASAAFVAIMRLIERMKIHSITVAQPDNPISMETVLRILRWSEEASIPAIMVSAADLETEKNLDDGTSRKDGWELYDEHSIFFVQDSFYLDKHDHLGCQSSAMYQVQDTITPVDFLSNMLLTKLRKYKEYSSADGIVGEYFRWVVENVQINRDYTFIPKILMNPNTSFYTALVKDGMVETPMGLLKPGASQIIPLLSIAPGN